MSSQTVLQVTVALALVMAVPLAMAVRRRRAAG